MIFHAGTGRPFEDGSGSWVALDTTHSAANKATNAEGYTLGNQHPDFSTGGANGMTQQQADCLAEFLNFADAGWDAYFDAINPGQIPVLYTIRSDADADRGETYYTAVCFACHGDPAQDATPFALPDGGGILSYLAGDGKYSELTNKVRWGFPDEIMTRDALENPTALNVADMMLYLQQLGGTGFALNPGLTGTWWNATRAGEGFLLEIGGAPATGDLTLFASFYTYDNMGNQAWLVAQPPTNSLESGAASVDVTVFRVTGPMWGDDFDPDDRNAMEWGTGTFSFPSCVAGSVTLTPGAEAQGMGFTDLSYELTRDLLESRIQCPSSISN
jgi:hypothetical protein